MESNCLTTHTTIFIFFFIVISSSFIVNGTTLPGRFTKIYAFGDSYTDTGNTRPQTRSNNKTPTNRYSNGRIVIDFVTEFLSLPYLPPYLDPKADISHGLNFAVAGSTAVDHDFFVNQNISYRIPNESIEVQLGWFKRFLGSHGCQIRVNKMSQKCRVLMEDALFWVGEIGANDYAYIIGSPVSPNTIQDLAVTKVAGVLHELLEMGAKHVIVEGLQTTGCLPLAMTLAQTKKRDQMGCVGSVNKVSYTHNAKLQTKLLDLRKQYPQAMISYADLWNSYRTVMMDPIKYGFKEPFKACCGSGDGPYNFNLLVPCGSPFASKPCNNPSQYVNWDGVHLTEAMYRVVADMFIHGGYCHPSFDVMLSS